MNFLELPLSEWRRIAQMSENAELINYLRQYARVHGDETFILQPVERDTGKQAAQILSVSLA